MADHLDKVIDIAKKLRKVAKKIEDPDIQSMVVDLNLTLADLKLQMAERHEEELRQRHGDGKPEQDGGHETGNPVFAENPHALAPTRDNG